MEDLELIIVWIVFEDIRLQSYKRDSDLNWSNASWKRPLDYLIAY